MSRVNELTHIVEEPFVRAGCVRVQWTFVCTGTLMRSVTTECINRERPFPLLRSLVTSTPIITHYWLSSQVDYLSLRSNNNLSNFIEIVHLAFSKHFRPHSYWRVTIVLGLSCNDWFPFFSFIVAPNSHGKKKEKNSFFKVNLVIETIEKLYSTCTNSSFASNKIMTVSWCGLL